MSLVLHNYEAILDGNLDLKKAQNDRIQEELLRGLNRKTKESWKNDQGKIKSGGAQAVNLYLYGKISGRNLAFLLSPKRNYQ